MMFKKSPNTEAINRLKSIPILKTILPKHLDEDGEIEPKKLTNDNLGFLFLSRYNKDEEEFPKVRERVSKVTESEGVITVETKSNESTHTTVVNSEKNRRYALSLATLATKPSRRLRIVEEGAINVLIELSLQHDRLIQVRCASAFASLSVEQEIRKKMFEENALAVIVQLAQNSNLREIKSDCCRAICNLCFEDNYEVKIVKDQDRKSVV